jgi:hypothetical protein
MPPRSSSNKEAPKPARKKPKKDTGTTKQGQPVNSKGGQDTENGEDVDGGSSTIEIEYVTNLSFK